MANTQGLFSLVRKAAIWSVVIGLTVSGGSAAAQGSCGRYQQILRTPSSAQGALEAMVEVINKLEANIAAIDEDCAFATANLSESQQAQVRRDLVNSLNVAKQNCRQLSAGGGGEC
jgi:hypothetical protein